MSNKIIPNNINFEYRTPLTVLKYDEKTYWVEKRHVIKNQSVYQSVNVNGHSVLKNHNARTQSVLYKPRIPLLLVLIACVFLIGFFLYHHEKSAETNTQIVYQEVKRIVYADNALNKVVASGELQDGKIFSNSSFEKITNEQLERLKNTYDTETYAMMLRVGVNSIYAEHGYVFGNEMWHVFFSDTSWYVPDHENSITYSCFNSIEQYNINRLVKEEEALAN